MQKGSSCAVNPPMSFYVSALPEKRSAAEAKRWRVFSPSASRIGRPRKVSLTLFAGTYHFPFLSLNAVPCLVCSCTSKAISSLQINLAFLPSGAGASISNTGGQPKLFTSTLLPAELIRCSTDSSMMLRSTPMSANIPSHWRSSNTAENLI